MIYNIFDFLSCKERVATATTFSPGPTKASSNQVAKRKLLTANIFENGQLPTP
jgi:hypothetical protein